MRKRLNYYSIFQRIASLLLAVLLIPIPSFAQNSNQTSSSVDQSTPEALATGTHTLGSYSGSSFDSVNLFNGNLSLSFPIAALSGRGGVGGGVTLSYNSKFWRVDDRSNSNPNGSNTYAVPTYADYDNEKAIFAPGWNLHLGRMIGRQSSWQDTVNGTTNSYTLSTFTFSAPDGTEYNFRDDLTDGQPLAAGNNNTPNQSRGKKFHSTDGTAATFISNDDVVDIPFALHRSRIYPDGVVVLRDGTRYILARGKVKEEHDRNGNIARYEYQGSRLKKITDSLGRTIILDYIEEATQPDRTVIEIKVTIKGFGGTDRVTSIKFGRLQYHLLGNLTNKTYSQLFPTLDVPSGGDTTLFDPIIVKQIDLPSTHQWKFFYNEYAEVIRVETPARGAVEYNMLVSSGTFTPQGQNHQEIFRRITERRIYPNANSTTVEGRTVYGDPSTDAAIQGVIEKVFNGDGTLISRTRHKFAYSPLTNYGDTGVPPKTGYQRWMQGKEIETAELSLDGNDSNATVKRLAQYTWEQRAPVSWITGSTTTFTEQPENDPRIKETIVHYIDSGQIFRTSLEYQDDVFIGGVGPFGYNNVISESVFDGDTLLRKTMRTFVTDAEYLKYNDDPVDKNIVINPHLVSLVKAESVLSPDGTEETRAEYEYDNYNRDLLLDRIFSVIPSHNTNFGTRYTKRGNVTSIVVGLGNSLTQTDKTIVFSQYDIAGNVVKTVGPKANQIVITDYDTQHFVFPIVNRQTIPEVTQEFNIELTYDFFTGLETSTKDFNNQITNYFYEDPDLLDRLTRVVRPTGSGETRYTYSSPGVYPAYIQVDSSLDNGRNLSSISYVDGFLKTIQQTSKDVNNGFVSVETTYDGLGREKKTTNPHRLGVFSTTDGYTTTSYDDLGRVSSVSTFDGNNSLTGTGTVAYNGTTVTVKDQSGKQRSSKSDALGRLTEVIEPTSDGFLTQSTIYKYDARGNITQVNQGQQIRTFSYDSLSRVLSSTTPEIGSTGNGSTYYEYDNASNLTKRTDARNTITTYIYDTLNRLLKINYSDTTPNVEYFYDGKFPTAIAPVGFTSQFAMGRVTAVVTVDTAREGATGLFYTYDNIGRITQSVQLLDGKYYTTNSQYNLASLPTSYTYPSGRVINHSYNVEGQLTDVTNNGQTISGQATYTADGTIESHKLGNNLFHQINYNDRFQPTMISLGSTSGSSDKWKLEYNYGVYDFTSLNNATTTPSLSTIKNQNNGNIGNIKLTPGVGSSPINQFFVYDELNRLQLAKEFFVAPDAPSNLTVSKASDIANISWVDNSNNETGFILERSDGQGINFVAIAQIPANQTSFQDSIGCGNVSFCYRVKAVVGSLSSDYSNSACVSTDACPPNPCQECIDTHCHSTTINCFGQIPPGGTRVCCEIIKIHHHGKGKGKGKGKKSYTPDNNAAEFADFEGLNLIAYDKEHSTLYFAESGNFLLRKVDSTGKIFTVAGNRNRPNLSGIDGLAKDSSIGKITALALEPHSKDIYFASENKLLKVETNSNLLKLVAGNGNKQANIGLNIADVKLNRVTALSFDSNHYWVSILNENSQAQLLKVDSNGQILAVSSNSKNQNTDGISINEASFSHISSLSVDSKTGDLYLADSSQKRVYKLLATTLELTTLLGGGKEKLHGLAIGKDIDLDDTPTSVLFDQDQLTVALVSTNRASGVYQINKLGQLHSYVDGLVPFKKSIDPELNDRLLHPQSLALDQKGNFLLIDSATDQIITLSSDSHDFLLLSSDQHNKDNQHKADGKTQNLVNEPNPLVDSTNWSQEYQYDRFGNQLAVVGTNGQTFTINSNNNHITDSGYQYDDAGNLIADSSGKYYRYDAENNLIMVANDSQFTSIIAQYFYDANGWRIKKVDSNITRFVYSQNGTLLAEYEGNDAPPSSPKRENIYGPSGLIAITEADQTYYLTPDHLGSNRIITESTGAVVTRRDFFPFGQTIDNSSDIRVNIPGYFSSAENIRQQFTGYERDKETGLDFAQARHFSAQSGRFLSPDPIGGAQESPQSWNSYAYVYNNPLNFVDPSGLLSQEPKHQGQTFDGVDNPCKLSEGCIDYIDITGKPGEGKVDSKTGEFVVETKVQEQQGIDSNPIYTIELVAPFSGFARGVLLRTGSQAVVRSSASFGARSFGAKLERPLYSYFDRLSSSLGLRKLADPKLISLAQKRGLRVVLNSEESAFGYGSIFLRKNATHAEFLEEFVHATQQRVAKDGISKLAKELSVSFAQRGSYLEANQALRVAGEIHGKTFLLRHSRLLGLNGLDRAFLRLQVNRLSKYGLSRGY